MRWQDLIATARLLTTTPHPNTQPLQDSLRRAISTAYYAMFHALASSNADCLAGAPHDPLTGHAWSRIYRGLNHSAAKRNLLQDQGLFSSVIRQFTETFAQMQDLRHSADYDPNRTFTLPETLDWIDRAASAIEGFMQTDADERKIVAIQSLIGRRAN
ncbi:MAG: hypothetical protein OXL37_00610 [Chloroflexota bacterium]|nr:hypothetical protein [Chloroflexota bacterium]MDE2959059.1 hypothetical protein [Chloroflexota bacterium]